MCGLRYLSVCRGGVSHCRAKTLLKKPAAVGKMFLCWKVLVLMERSLLSEHLNRWQIAATYLQSWRYAAASLHPNWWQQCTGQWWRRWLWTWLWCRSSPTLFLICWISSTAAERTSSFVHFWRRNPDCKELLPTWSSQWVTGGGHHGQVISLTQLLHRHKRQTTMHIQTHTNLGIVMTRYSF